MNIKQLETFYWVDRLGSFSAAADRVCATQSTVSMRIQELEQSLGVKLFDRSQRTAKLTAKGKELVPFVEQLVELTAELQQRITPQNLLSGLVRLGVIEVIGYTWLPTFVVEMEKRYPNIILELEIGLAHELNEKLRSNALDLVFNLGRPPGSNYKIESLGDIQFSWMAGSNLGIADDDLTPEIFRHWPLITLNRLSYHYGTLQEWLRTNNVRCKKIITCNSMAMAACLAKQGLGITLLPEKCYPTELGDGTLRLIKTLPSLASVETSAMYAVDEYQPLVKALTSVAKEMSGETL